MGIVSPALPGIARGLEVAPASAMAVVTLYYLAYAAAMPLLGKLGDRWGTGRMLRAGLLAFGVGSLLAAAAPSLGWLLAGRVLQALGGGGVVPVAVAAVARRAPPARRGRALGLVGAVFGVAGVLGP
ncbi:MAG: MFS transporter, partial [Thermaerobacter sp.]|nr:MFS transporter [Thermaerobacter sp.]